MQVVEKRKKGNDERVWKTLKEKEKKIRGKTVEVGRYIAKKPNETNKKRKVHAMTSVVIQFHAKGLSFVTPRHIALKSCCR